ncbi:hypothetical protein K0M31_011832 [Melipona bicolor]|uniref:Uncharacterized protein n=1 Tax=Melipona bicolor TaxID=60889 RepID=A0AA40KV37_9HYME|nr:hypothetical protein K0M31_011832 [Melipona bicolor]
MPKEYYKLQDTMILTLTLYYVADSKRNHVVRSHPQNSQSVPGVTRKIPTHPFPQSAKVQTTIHHRRQWNKLISMPGGPGSPIESIPMADLSYPRPETRAWSR